MCENMPTILGPVSTEIMTSVDDFLQSIDSTGSDPEINHEEPEWKNPVSHQIWIKLCSLYLKQLDSQHQILTALLLLSEIEGKKPQELERQLLKSLTASASWKNRLGHVAEAFLKFPILKERFKKRTDVEAVILIVRLIRIGAVLENTQLIAPGLPSLDVLNCERTELQGHLRLLKNKEAVAKEHPTDQHKITESWLDLASRIEQLIGGLSKGDVLYYIKSRLNTAVRDIRATVGVTHA